jgi:hypothetical protein
VIASDVADLAPDVLRHRLVLTYDALGDGVAADDMLERILGRVAGIRPEQVAPRPDGDAAPDRRGRFAAAADRLRAEDRRGAPDETPTERYEAA